MSDPEDSENLDDIQDLLDELDAQDESVSDVIEQSEQSEDVLGQNGIVDDIGKSNPLDDVENIIDGFTAEPPMRPIDVRKVDLSEEKVTDNVVEQEISNIPVDVEKYKEQLDIVTQEVLNACRSDRQEAQDVINNIQSKIEEFCKNSPKSPPPKALIDGLVKTVEVKSNINQNAIRMMDTNAKFLSSIKSSINFKQNNNISTSPKELIEILNNPNNDSDA